MRAAYSRGMVRIPFKFLSVLFLASLLLAGCGTRFSPAPIIFGGKSGTTRQSTLVYPKDGKVVAGRGETVHVIARRYGVAVRDLIALNRLYPPYLLAPGQIVRLPKPMVHEVRRGDTLFSIARRYNVDVAALTRMNGIPSPYTIYPGQRLSLPGAVALATPKTVARSVPPPQPQPQPQSQPQTTVRPEPQATVKRSELSSPRPPVASVPPPMASGRFLWPVKGNLLSKFGDKGGGLRNDGINVAAPKGAPIHAAENGVVIYAGNELKGFGNLLLVKHADGWMTAYAHAESLVAKRGDQVKKGQVIARVGATGNVDAPQLHFELRHKKVAMDPIPQLQRG